MKLLIEKIPDLRALFINQARILLSAEEQIVDGLGTLRDAATDPQLIDAFQSHLEESKVHVTRLQDILNHTTGEAESIKCKAVSALFGEAEELIQETTHGHDTAYGPLRDAALIAAAQRVEHYEIAAYGAVRSFARLLQLSAPVDILDKTIHEESHADRLLTSISERINHDAEVLT